LFHFVWSDSEVIKEYKACITYCELSQSIIWYQKKSGDFESPQRHHHANSDITDLLQKKQSCNRFSSKRVNWLAMAWHQQKSSQTNRMNTKLVSADIF